MASRPSPGVAGGVVLLVLAVVAVGLASGTTRTETEGVETFDFDPQVHGPLGAVVVSRSESGGFSVFGLQLQGPDHTVSVQFIAPPGCLDVIAYGDTWPVSNEACQTSVSVVGAIDARGTTAFGDTLIGMKIPVSADCYREVALGMTWPPNLPACSPNIR